MATTRKLVRTRRLTVKRVSVIEEDGTPVESVTHDDKLFSYGDPVAFSDLEKLLAKGHTNIVVLDLLGRESTITADAIKGSVETPKKQRRHKPTKFEKALAKFLEEHDIEFEDDTIIHLAIIAHDTFAPAVRH